MEQEVVVLSLRRLRYAKVGTESMGVMQSAQGIERFVPYNK